MSAMTPTMKLVLIFHSQCYLPRTELIPSDLNLTEDEIKTFSEKKKKKTELTASRPILQETLKKVLRAESK